MTLRAIARGVLEKYRQYLQDLYLSRERSPAVSKSRGVMDMFKHILIPTDGSEPSEAAIQAAVQFAKSIKARVTGFYAMPKFHMLAYGPEMVTDTRQEFAKDCQAHADRFLAVIMRAAKAADVPCETALQSSDQPYEAIIATAQERDCDLIMMASHGRRGAQA